MKYNEGDTLHVTNMGKYKRGFYIVGCVYHGFSGNVDYYIMCKSTKDLRNDRGIAFREGQLANEVKVKFGKLLLLERKKY